MHAFSSMSEMATQKSKRSGPVVCFTCSIEFSTHRAFAWHVKRSHQF